MNIIQNRPTMKFKYYLQIFIFYECVEMLSTCYWMDNCLFLLKQNRHSQLNKSLSIFLNIFR
jgi:hypothetical protein